ncbi:MAG: PBSX family phage terminase large subunit [Alteromonadaceae bacterium]|nr:PBSX family phage terminase large subunit [Alteromonadaceae bacterium]
MNAYISMAAQIRTKTNTPTLNPALKDFWLKPARNKVLYGGRASSKSWDAAGFAIYLGDNFKLRFLCARQFQNKITESVYTLLKLQIERFGLQHRYDIQRDKIINRFTGTEFLFYGLWRHIDEVKSLEGIDVCWLEEAHNISESQWEVLEPTVRKEHSQFWVIFNPRLATDYVWKRFVISPPPNTVVRRINYPENPFLSKTMLDLIASAKEDDYEDYEHIYLGVPRTDDGRAIIKRSWIEAAIDAHDALGFKAAGIRRIGFDVADSGDDKCANVYAHGSVVMWADEWKAGEDELLKSCSLTYSAARQRDAEITYDSIGVGASAGAKFKELNDSQDRKLLFQKFNAGGAVFQPDKHYEPGITNKDMFANIKSQAWWLLADRFRNTYNAVRKGEKFDDDELISIASDCPFIDQIIDELSTPKRDYDANGRVKVESKKDMAKREVASPNLADAFVMCFAPTTNSRKRFEALAS